MKRIMVLVVVTALAMAALAACSGGNSSQAAQSSSQASGSASSQSVGSAASQAASVSSTAFDLAEGEHTIAVKLEGGDGRVAVESPAKLRTAADGSMIAVIVCSSPDFDLMVVGGQEYWPVPRVGNATFEIPVSALDTPITVQVESIAGDDSRMLDCTLSFDSSTLQ